MIGEAVTRREDARVLRGQARYVDDIERPHCAHAAFVRSPHAHAAIRAIRGALRIGPLTRQGALERSELVQRGWPLLVDAVRLVGHPRSAVAGRWAAPLRMPIRGPSCRWRSSRSTLGFTRATSRSPARRCSSCPVVAPRLAAAGVDGDYRRALLTELVRRAITTALQ
jgi:Aldehyde oxidase and xanthine dehydrogenase, a/b hammerhead domain